MIHKTKRVVITQVVCKNMKIGPYKIADAVLECMSLTNVWYLRKTTKDGEEPTTSKGCAQATVNQC